MNEYEGKNVVGISMPTNFFYGKIPHIKWRSPRDPLG